MTLRLNYNPDGEFIIQATASELAHWGSKGFPAMCKIVARDLVNFCLEQIALRSITSFDLNFNLEIENFGPFPHGGLKHFVECFGPINLGILTQVEKELAYAAFTCLPQYLDPRKIYTVGKRNFSLSCRPITPQKLRLKFMPMDTVAMTADTVYFANGKKVVAVERECALVC